jgi:ADP-heptose:LPS heptosyltransferase
MNPSLIFLPVSGPKGMGEYIRCLTIAEAFQKRWPGARIRFVINRQAPYADAVPFDTEFLEGSPTANTPAVCDLFERERPDVVIFDNAGRTKQLRAASRCGARTVFISRRRKRLKAFRTTWLRMLDQHWIAYPKEIEGPLFIHERLMLRFNPGPEIIFLGAVFPESSPEKRDALKAKLEIGEERYLLFSPGGGGAHSSAPRATELFTNAAALVAAATSLKVIVVLGPGFRGDVADLPGVTLIPSLSHEEMSDLIHDAVLLVINGGTTLTQALVLRKPCVAVPVADDQAARIRRCAKMRLVVHGTLDADAMCGEVLSLLDDPGKREELVARVTALGLTNGARLAVEALERLLEPSPATKS